LRNGMPLLRSLFALADWTHIHVLRWWQVKGREQELETARKTAAQQAKEAADLKAQLAKIQREAQEADIRRAAEMAAEAEQRAALAEKAVQAQKAAGQVSLDAQKGEAALAMERKKWEAETEKLKQEQARALTDAEERMAQVADAQAAVEAKAREVHVPQFTHTHCLPSPTYAD
jgi:hypothetical protein